jgi:hypothetical protein
LTEENNNLIKPIIKTTDTKMMIDRKDVLKEEATPNVAEVEQEEEWARRDSKEDATMMIMMFTQHQGAVLEETKMTILDPEEGEDLAALREAIEVEDSEDLLDIEEAKAVETSMIVMVNYHLNIMTINLTNSL